MGSIMPAMLHVFLRCFFKTSNALFASPKARSDLVEKGELE